MRGGWAKSLVLTAAVAALGCPTNGGGKGTSTGPVHGSAIPAGGCEVTSVKVWHGGNSGSAPTASPPFSTAVEQQGSAQLHVLGPHANGTDLQHVIWVEYRGNNVTDCEPERFWTGRQVDSQGVTTINSGYSGPPARFTPVAGDCDGIAAYEKEPGFVGDAPGFINITAAAHPLASDLNFLVRLLSTQCLTNEGLTSAASCNTNSGLEVCIAAEAWFNLNQETDAAGTVAQNDVNVLAEVVY